MSTPTFTPSQIFKHMTPGTLCAWVSDMDKAPDELDNTALDLMSAALDELFALVGMKALTILETYGVAADHPMVFATEAYNKDGE